MFPTKSNGDGSIVASDVDWSYPPIGATVVAFGKRYEVVARGDQTHVVDAWQPGSAFSLGVLLTWGRGTFAPTVRLSGLAATYNRILVEVGYADPALEAPCRLCFAPIGKPCAGQDTRVQHSIDYKGALHIDTPFGSSASFLLPLANVDPLPVTVTLVDDVPKYHSFLPIKRIVSGLENPRRQPEGDLEALFAEWRYMSEKHAWLFSCTEGTTRHVLLKGHYVPLVYAKKETIDVCVDYHCLGAVRPVANDSSLYCVENAAPHPLVWVIDGSRLDASLMASAKKDPWLSHELGRAWSREVKRRSAALKKPVVGRQVYCESQFDTHDDLD